MKQRFGKWIAGIACIALLPVFLLCRGAALPALYGESYYAQFPAMVEKADKAQGPKILVLGGSNVAFGLNSRQLEQELGQFGRTYTVCGYGLYAAVGTSVLFPLALDCLQKGDIVVLAMEPTSQTHSTYFGANAFWKCAEEAPWLLSRVNGSQKSALAGGYLPYLQERAGIVRSGDFPKAEGVYAKESFDGSGDLIFNRPGNCMALGFDTARTVDFGAVEIAPDFAEQVRSFLAAAEKKGASVVLSFSPVNASAVTSGEEELYGFFTDCCQAFGCPAISDPNDYILDSGWFYDNNFHLNSAGAEIRTHQLAVDLLAWLGVCREPSWEMPEMPAPVRESPEETADTGDFIFTPASAEGGWLVSGVTPAGREKTALAIPETVDGGVVTGFTAEAFAGCEHLEELTLSKATASIPDGAFADCPNLTRLVLMPGASPPALGEAPFAGADGLKVYVPREDYSRYRDGYGCEDNPWQSYLDRIVTY